MHFLKISKYLLISFGLQAASAMAADASAPKVAPHEGTLDLLKVFQSCPIIYSTLLLLSIAAFIIWSYSLLTLKSSEMMPKNFLNQLRELLAERRFETALSICQQDHSFSASIVACAIAARKHGPQMMMDSMKSEGKRRGSSIWQRISILNEIAVIAPMIGLLGTVIGLFFAFYDMNRSAESIASIFDGLGIAVGTTVMGLIVAILAMLFYTSLKFRVINLMNKIENELLSLINIVETDDHPTPSKPD